MSEEHLHDHDHVHLPVFYANVVHFATGPFDLVMDFGMQGPEHRRQGGHSFDNVARVVMSLSHAKSMLTVLADRIARYEQQYGIIPSPHYPAQPKPSNGEEPTAPE